MKIYYDTEFSERGGDFPIEFISIGMVREDGAELYLVSKEFNPAHCNPWVQQHVLSNLPDKKNLNAWKTRSEIREWILGFVGEEPEFWAWYAAYDHVVLCQLFGAMVNLPRTWPMYTHDLKQEFDRLGNPRCPIPQNDEHIAIGDARWVKKAHEWLIGVFTLEYNIG